MEESLPPGFRFHPTDEELITYYLGNKVSDIEFKTRVVADVDLNKCEPWDLPGKASMGEKEWYFFSLRDRKYPTGLRTNRATEAGYWKTTGKDKEITRANVLVGMKKTLVFYRGRAPKGEKTNWVMHEYRLENKVVAFKPTKGEWVVCRVFEKSSTPPKKCHHQETTTIATSPPMSRDEEMMTINNTNDIESESNMNNIAHQLQQYNSCMMMSSNWPSAANYNNTLSSVNSLLLTALQHRPVNYSFMPPLQLPLQGENEYFDNVGSSSRPPSDQGFDVDSNIW